ncbi:hypothetical protein Psch_03055 [Pelotomaculum schinkii]|uniref:Uncharacterized protein n=1 Tax=Pelotomaculum schinkii TaxID=78350 RepID=A0A4Y7RBB5_9FIRM|nr:MULTISPECIES: hypothetical protein [Pelotomaculum]TEB06013.1 hypothetical protein Psch_03055 [Pelotomaculum schinkii]TEB13947.1 hypothetical protein Psfp_03297 [Pelotomaculum sp. FP]
MTNKWRTLLRISGFIFILAGILTGIFTELPSNWSTVVVFLGLGQFLAAGGFG